MELKRYAGAISMPFYFRKSVSAGPFRLNFSKGGIGMSVGVKGLRIGTGPRGHYIHAGLGGLYYRSSIGRSGETRRAPASTEASPRRSVWEASGVEMQEIESGDVLDMRDASIADLLDDINEKAARTPLGKIVGWAGLVLGGLMLFADASAAFWTWVLTLPAWLFARWLDSYQLKSALYYDLEPNAEEAYQQLVTAFDDLAGCNAAWHIAAGGAVRDLTTWKRNAGAAHIIDRKPTKLTYGLPKVLVANITPPAVQVGIQTLYFLPDVVFVEHGRKMGAIGYADLNLRWQDSNFIEDGRVPADAKIIGYSWKHPNKNGGPDRRFKDNYEIPVCRYEALHLNSPSGLNELLQFSRSGLSIPLLHAVNNLKHQNQYAKGTTLQAG